MVLDGIPLNLTLAVSRLNSNDKHTQTTRIQKKDNCVQVKIDI